MKRPFARFLSPIAAFAMLVVWFPVGPLLAQNAVPPYEKTLLERVASSRIDLGIQDSSLNYLGRWGWGWCGGVAMMGNYIFTGSGPTLLWLDAADKRHPTVVWDTLDNSGVPPLDYDIARSFAIQDSFGYALWGFKMVVVDFRRPRTPAIIGEVELGQGMGPLVVQGSFVFVQKIYGGLFCIDVSNPSSPYLRAIGSVPSVMARDMTITGHNLYVGDYGDYTVKYVNVSNPDSMRVAPLYNVLPYVSAIRARDTLLLMGGSPLVIFSIVVPDTPRFLSQVEVPDDFIASLILRGDTAYVGTGQGKVVAVNISDTRNPVIVGTYAPTRTDVSANSLALEDTVLSCAYWGTGLSLFSVRNVASMSVLSLFPTGDRTERLMSKNGFIYVTSGRAGLWVVDMSDPLHPRRRGNAQTAGYAYDLVVDSNVAFVSVNNINVLSDQEDWNGVQAIDVSQPDSPRVVSSYAVNSACGLSKSGSLLFVTHGDVASVPVETTLTILDVSDPSQIQCVGTIVGGYDAFEVAARDSIAFVAARHSGLKILDCRNPASAQLLSTTFARAAGVSIEGHKAYVHRADSVFVLDISNLAAPFVVGKTRSYRPASFFGPCRTLLSDDLMFWASGNAFGAYEVSDPAQPRVAFGDLRFFSDGVDVVGDSVFVTDLHEGVWVFSYTSGPNSVGPNTQTVPGTVRLFPNYPNPFNATTHLKFATAIRRHVRLDVFNLLGQRISCLFDGVAEAGEHTVEFDASSLSSGVFFYTLSSDNVNIPGRMLLVK